MVIRPRPIGGPLFNYSEALPSGSLVGDPSTFDLKLSGFIRDIFHQATDPTMGIPMLLASPVYHVGKVGLLKNFLARPAITCLGRRLTLNVLPVLGGFGAETAAFSLSSRALSHYLHGPVSWDPASLIHDTAMTGMTLALLKGAGFAGRKGVQWARGLDEIQAHRWTRADHRAMFWTGQVSAYLGLVGSHGLQNKFFPTTHAPGGNIWIDALGTHLALGIGAHGGRQLLGAKFHALERRLAARAQQLHQETGAAFLPMGIPGRVLAAGTLAPAPPGMGNGKQNPSPLGLFQSEGGGGGSPRPPRQVHAGEMVEAMDRFKGNMTQAAQSLGISQSTLRNKILREGKNAPEGSPLRQWAERISPEGRSRAQGEHWKRVVAALRESEGHISLAAEKLKIPHTTLVWQLKAVRRQEPEYKEIVEWASRLSPEGRRRTQIRFWIKMARCLSERRGNFLASAQELEISNTQFRRELDQVLASGTISFMESHIRSRILAVLARWKPEDPHLPKALQEEPDPAVRLALVENLLSNSPHTQAMLQDRIRNDPEPAVAAAARRALQRSEQERVLNLFYFDELPHLTGQVGVALGVSSPARRRYLNSLVRKGVLVSLGIDRYGLSPSGRMEAQRNWHQNLWDLMDSALESFQGQHTPASRLLGISISTLSKYLQGSFGLVRLEQGLEADRFYHPLYRVPDAHPLHRWKQNIQRKFWSEIARVFDRYRGDGALTAAALEISEEKLFHEMDRALATQGVSRMESPIRSKLLEALARWHPGDPRATRGLEMEPDPAVRLSIVQNLFSTSPRTEQLLMDRIQNDGSEVVSHAASHSLQRSPSERVLGLLSSNGGNFPRLQLAAALEQSPDGTRALLNEMVEKGWVARAGSDNYILSPAGREVVGRKWVENLWDLLDTAMEETGGHQGNAAPLLGISRHTMHKYLAASLGRVNRSTIQGGQHYYGPEFLAPPDHPVRRWRSEDYLADLRDQRRVEQFGEHWIRIDAAMEQGVGVMNEAARILGISEASVRKHIRIAAGLGQEPLARWGDPDYIQARQDEVRRAHREQVRQERISYLREQSPYRDIPTDRLALGEPDTVPESIRRELLTRYSIGDERAGQALIRLYDAWIIKVSHGRRPEEIPMEDMIQAGRMGLLQAAFMHDSGQGAKFLTYANYYILREHVRLIRDHMGTYISGDDRDLMRAMHALQNRTAVQGESLTLDALAAQLEITSDRLEQIRMAEKAEQILSLEYEETKEGRGLYEVIRGESPMGDRQRLRNTFINGVREFLNRNRGQGNSIVPPELLIDEFVDEPALAERFGVRLDQVQEQRAELYRNLQNHLRELGIEEDYFE